MSGAVLILGATSPIARSTAGYLASKGHPLFLASRDEEELTRIASDIQARYGVQTHTGVFDAEEFTAHAPFLQQVVKDIGPLEGVVVAFGYLGQQSKAAEDFEEGRAILNRNFVGACSILSECANYFQAKKSGFIVGISSVAGDRGRQSNYYYGAAKSGLSTFLQGLRNRLHDSGVQVLTVKPGFVDTGMTYGKPGMFLVASPKNVGATIGRAIEQRKDIIYVPWFWRYIMGVIKMIPERIFRRLKL